ncbi:thioesterase II family protein [Kitasatospora sp. NBC_00315]|uniref:thioesterase II family protein n=1 Tax=Kitasatospora sp. NBC_00315 TaxID=2975963 RepID=UPI0032560843
MTSSQDLWFRRYHPAPAARTTLYCFPHAGGAATYFHPMSAMMAPEFDLVAVQYPGRQDRLAEPLVASITELADRIAAEFDAERGAREERTGEPDGPTAFFGHSMGAIVAFEVALRLQDSRRPGPAVLFASGCRAPSRVRDDGVHLRGDEGVVEELRSMGGTDSRVLSEPELLAMLLPAMRNDYKAIETYRQTANAQITAPIAVLAATDDLRVTMEEARAWHGHTTAGGAAHFFDGGHFYLEAQAPAVVGIVTDELRAATVAGWVA